MSKFDYKKWLDVKNSKNSNPSSFEIQQSQCDSHVAANFTMQEAENKNEAPAISTIPAIFSTCSTQNSRNSKNSTSGQTENLQEFVYKIYGITIAELQEFLGDDWVIYKNDPERLTNTTLQVIFILFCCFIIYVKRFCCMSTIID